MLLRIFSIAVFLPLYLLPTHVSAHHSVSAEYDTTKSNTIDGVVTRVWFRNPHVRYYITVVGSNGEEVLWNAHGHNVSYLSQIGWTKSTVKVGDKITMMGDASRDGSPKMFIRSIKLPTGKVIINGRGNIVSDASKK